MTGDANPRQSSSHFVVTSYVCGVIRCAGCGESWEQPYYAANEWFVCPHCLHSAKAPKERS